MKALISFVLLLCLNEYTFAAKKVSADVQRAAAENIQMLQEEIAILKAEKFSTNDSNAIFGELHSRDRNNRCDDDDIPSTCVPNCQIRFSDGRCGSYGQDYCGPRANCAANCQIRFADGRCGSYKSDFCGPMADCAPNCVIRHADGACGSYGPDICY